MNAGASMNASNKKINMIGSTPTKANAPVELEDAEPLPMPPMPALNLEGPAEENPSNVQAGGARYRRKSRKSRKGSHRKSHKGRKQSRKARRYTRRR